MFQKINQKCRALDRGRIRAADPDRRVDQEADPRAVQGGLAIEALQEVAVILETVSTSEMLSCRCAASTEKQGPRICIENLNRRR